MLSNWRRTTHVTKGFDPTEVVAWSDGSITIVEFQQVYSVADTRRRPEVVAAVVLGEILHTLLEEEWQEQQYEGGGSEWPIDDIGRIYGGA
jgi:hypothetical protein